MELVYIAMLLHKAGKEINEENVKKVANAAGIQAEDAQVKALVAALDGVDIDKEIKEASVAMAAPAGGSTEQKQEKKEEKKEEEKKPEEAAAGLGALFG